MGRKPDPNKRQHIIRTAAAVFARKGFAGTRMVAIADAAGIGKGTIYGYFRNKEALFYSVFQYMVLEPTHQIFSAIASNSETVAERLQHVVEFVLDTWLAHLEMYSLIMEFWSAATTLPSRERFKAALRQIYRDMRCLVADLIQEGIDDGEFDTHAQPEKIAAAMVGALDSFLLQAWLDRDFDARDMSRVFMNLILKVLQPAT